MSEKSVQQKVIERFSSMVTAEAEGFRAVGWGSERSQARRFEVMNQIANLKGARILDVGCGLAAFHEWLKAQGIEHDYYGCDITQAMVERAREKTGLSTILLGDIDQFDPVNDASAFDYVFASGIFCFDPQGGHDAMNATIEKMFALARAGVCFNSLSALADTKEADEFYADPARTLADCQKLSRSVVLRHDYHPADFSVYIYRETA